MSRDQGSSRDDRPRASGRPTLLVFTLGAARERRRRRLLPGRHRGDELRLHQACLDAAVAAGRESGCRVLVSTPSARPLPAGAERLAQHGHGFAGRLTRAVARAGAATRDAPLLVVGSDVPDLAASHLRAALAALEADPRRVVVGPATDGGLYLIAARGGSIRALVERVRWCRRDTLRSFEAACRAAGRPVVRLEPLGDLDRRADLESWLAARPRRPVDTASAVRRRLGDALRRLLAALRRPPAPPRLGRPRAVPATVAIARGPPPRR